MPSKMTSTTHDTAFVNAFRATPPFDELSPALNIFGSTSVPTDSGADDPAGAGGYWCECPHLL